LPSSFIAPSRVATSIVQDLTIGMEVVKRFRSGAKGGSFLDRQIDIDRGMEKEDG